jgi:hypothetical protein
MKNSLFEHMQKRNAAMTGPVTPESKEQYKQIKQRRDANLNTLKGYSGKGPYPGKALNQAIAQQDSLSKHPFNKEYSKTYGKVKGN